jgi:hypothetical protein
LLESEKIQKEKDLAGAAKTLHSLGAPDCPVVHRTVSGAPGWRLVNWPLSGIRRRRTAKIHRTVRWRTGLSGGAPDCPVSQRSAAQSARDAWPSQRSDGGTRLSGVHRTVSGAPTAPNLQRSAVPILESNLHRTLNSACPVAHWTVRCATRQKARIAFPDCLLRLLAALGL